MKKFYDTCALLNLGARAFDEHFVISSQTLIEIERIKTSRSKDADVKAAARRVSRLIDQYESGFDMVYTGVYDLPPDEHICYDA